LLERIIIIDLNENVSKNRIKAAIRKKIGCDSLSRISEIGDAKTQNRAENKIAVVAIDAKIVVQIVCLSSVLLT